MKKTPESDAHPDRPGRHWVLGLAAMLALCASLPTRAAEPPTGAISVIFENDAFYNTDRHYTNGFQVSWTTPGNDAADWTRDAAALLPLFPASDTLRVSYSLGQRTYTPTDLGDPTPDPEDRPYAGWLYGALGLMAKTDGRRLDQAQIAIGVIGPLSLAEQVQDATHDILATEDPRGWDTQLDNEPAILLTYQRSWRALVAPSIFGFSFDAIPHLGGALGNVFTYVNTGLTLRFGHQLPDDFSPPRMGTNLPGASHFGRKGGFSWYLFVGIEGRAVARNIFLDGNTFEDSRGVDRKPLVGDLQLGLVLSRGRLSLAYTHVLRTREFESQEEPDEFGVVSVSSRF